MNITISGDHTAKITFLNGESLDINSDVCVFGNRTRPASEEPPIKLIPTRDYPGFAKVHSRKTLKKLFKIINS